MLQYRLHGGQCCGRSHAFDFSGRRQDIERSLRGYLRSANREMCMEVVLTNSQLSRKPWLRGFLTEMGFEKVFSFKNPNTRSICNVFLRSDNKR